MVLRDYYGSKKKGSNAFAGMSWGGAVKGGCRGKNKWKSVTFFAKIRFFSCIFPKNVVLLQSNLRMSARKV